MKRCVARFALVACLATSSDGLAQDRAVEPGINAGYLSSAQKADLLAQQPAVSDRTEARVAVGMADSNSPLALGVAIDDLLRNLELRGGADPGALAFGGSTLSLHVEKSAKALTGQPKDPFALIRSAASVNSIATHAVTEFNVVTTPTGTQKVAAINAIGSAFASRSAKTGDAPVTLEILSVDLTASQQGGQAATLPVVVRVGKEIRTLQAGETADFGTVEVEVLYSTNLSSEPDGTLEAPPYGLAVRVRGARVPN